MKDLYQWNKDNLKSHGLGDKSKDRVGRLNYKKFYDPNNIIAKHCLQPNVISNKSEYKVTEINIDLLFK